MEWGTVPAWASVVVAVLSLGIAAFSLRANRKRKALGYETLLDQPLVNLNAPGYPELTVSHDGVPVSKPRTVTMAVRNIGNVEALSTDYSAPITLRIKDKQGDRTSILRASVQTVDATQHQVDWTFSEQDDQHVSVDPVLLNPGDTLLFQFLLDGDGQVEVLARLAGFRLVDTTSSLDTRGVWEEVLLTAVTLLVPVFPGGVRRSKQG